MEPSLMKNSWINVWRFFDKKELQRCQIVFVSHPKNKNYKLLRRIVGLPREEITINKGKLYINKKILNWENTPCEKRLRKQFKKSNSFKRDYSHENFYKTLSLKKNEYFLLADNRQNSIDSRLLGPFQRNLIEGIVYSK